MAKYREKIAEIKPEMKIQIPLKDFHSINTHILSSLGYDEVESHDKVLKYLHSHCENICLSPINLELSRYSLSIKQSIEIKFNIPFERDIHIYLQLPYTLRI